jgi:N-acetylmuramoyl-L-alanine amidase
MGMRVAVVVGHNERAPGAYALEPIGMCEYPWNLLVAHAMVDRASAHGLDARFFLRTPEGGYTAEVRRVYREVDAWGAECSIELHFNAAGPSATGTETLHSGGARSRRLAGHVQAQMLARLKLRDRGLLERRTGRGSLSLMAGRAPAILVEPFFGSNRIDSLSAAALGGPEGFAEMYLAGLKAYAEDGA